MKYVTTIECRAGERGIEKGSLETAREAVIEAITLRFQDVPEELSATLRDLSDGKRLKSLLRQAILAGPHEEFEHALEAGVQR